MRRARAQTWVRLGAVAAAAVSTPSLAEGAVHGDIAAPVVLWLALIFIVAKLGGDLAIRLKQPAVLGELLAGVVVGNLPIVGITGLQHLGTDVFLDMFARIGVIVLLFEVGLESTVAQMMKVGASAALVACVGVVSPFALGWLVSAWLLPSHSTYVHLFLGATLTATSVGITARVLKDLERSQTPEARVILGAAVIDDVLGLVILAVVTGVIAAAETGERLAASDVVVTLLKALGFLVTALVAGRWVSPRMFHLASALKARSVLLPVGLAFCFLLAYLADRIGLAPIVGAFAAGLILEDVHYKDLEDREQHSLEELIHPVSSFFVPVFFVLMGVRTDLVKLLEPGVVGLAFALTAVAIVGKLGAGVGALGGVDRLTIGLGMIPRGEVGLIFASIGASLTVHGVPVVDGPVFSAVVVMVILTTLVTPPLLAWRLRRLGAPRVLT